MKKLLIVEDDLGLQKQYKWSIKNFELFEAGDLRSAIKSYKENSPDLVLLDLGLPPDQDNASEGLKFLDLVNTTYNDTKVIVLTGSEQHLHALKAIEKGAFDFLQKGGDSTHLNYSLSRASDMQDYERDNERRRNEPLIGGCLIGESEVMHHAFKTLSQIAPVPIRTLLSGESGTGKELFAQQIHRLSGCKGNFVAINCASIPKDLLESELFGHEKGAFTGAYKRQIGKIEKASEGTLFLDEIGDMPSELQAKLLRFLQENEIERVGGSEAIPVKTRVICATHRDLNEMKKSDDFREDLYYRLAEFTLLIPALRERGKDIILLAEYFLSLYKKELSLNSVASGFSDNAKSAMLNHDWSGNVRELQNRVKSALIVSHDRELITNKDLQLDIRNENHPLLTISPDEPIKEGLTLGQARLEAEYKALKLTMKKEGGNITEASKSLGISRQTFYTVAERCGFDISKNNN